MWPVPPSLASGTSSTGLCRSHAEASGASAHVESAHCAPQHCNSCFILEMAALCPLQISQTQKGSGRSLHCLLLGPPFTSALQEAPAGLGGAAVSSGGRRGGGHWRPRGTEAVAPARACPPPGVQQRPWTLPSTAESGPPGASMCQGCDMSPTRGCVSISTKFASGGTLEWRPEF